MSGDNRTLADGALQGECLAERYLVQEKIGKGGMAWVYRALDQKHDEDHDEPPSVALKVLFSQMSDDEEIRARFLREARIQSRLEHPHIVEVTDTIEERGLTAFVLEYCNRGNLVDFLRERQRPFTLQQVQTLFLPILGAMAHAHEQGVIHRDLKPHNILLQEQQGLLMPKITDFGIAKQFGEVTLTNTGTMIGTLHYMSPEQVHESKNVDHKADIYSLGVLLYQLLSGRLPFKGKAPVLMLHILHDPPPPMKGIDSRLREVTFRCLQKDAGRRFSSCRAFHEALSEALDECLAEHPPEDEAPLFFASHDDLPAIPAQGSPSYDALGSTAAWRKQAVDQDKESAHEADDQSKEAPVSGAGGPLDATMPAEMPAPSQTPSSLGNVMGAPLSQTAELAATVEVDDQLLARLKHDLPSDVDVEKIAAQPLGATPPQKDRRWAWKGGSVLLLGLLLVASQVWWMNRTEQRQPSQNVPASQRGIQPDTRRPATTQEPTRRALVPRVFERALPDTAPSPRPSQNTPDTKAKPQAKPPAQPTKRRTAPLPLPKKTLALRCKQGRAQDCLTLGEGLLKVAQKEAETKEAIKALQRACVLGDADTCVRLGAWFQKGTHVTKDAEQAERHLQQACQLNKEDICLKLGLRWKALRRYGKARVLFERACSLRSSTGCVHLGWLHQNGLGGPMKYKVAGRSYKQACDLGDADGCNSLGALYSKGLLGSRRDDAAARTLYAKACRKRNVLGCYNYGLCTSQGWGGAAHLEHATTSLRFSCDKGDMPSCYVLGVLLTNKRGKEPPAPKRAAKLLKRACEGKQEDACYHLAYMIAHGVVGKASCGKANPLFRKACRLGRKPCITCFRNKPPKKEPTLRHQGVRTKSY